MPKKKRKASTDESRATVAAHVAANADEDVQQVITAVHRLSKRLDQWYESQLSDLNLSAGEWAVLNELARSDDSEPLTPSQLAQATDVAPSSMTHRLDRLVERGLVLREADQENRTRILVRLSDQGWELFAEVIREASLVESDVVAPLTDRQVRELAGLLERLVVGLDEDLDDSADSS